MHTLPIIILDRDGIINQDSIHYIKSPDEFVMLPGSIDAIAALKKAGYRIGVATNQSGLSRGLYNEETLAAIHHKMLAEIRAAGGDIEAIVHCPHLPEEGCACRKPKPGMLFELAAFFQCKPKDMIFIGDKLTDVQAAEAAGAAPRLVLSLMTDKTMLNAYPHVPVYPSLRACVEDLLSEQYE